MQEFILAYAFFKCYQILFIPYRQYYRPKARTRKQTGKELHVRGQYIPSSDSGIVAIPFLLLLAYFSSFHFFRLLYLYELLFKQFVFFSKLSALKKQLIDINPVFSSLNMSKGDSFVFSGYNYFSLLYK